MSHDSRRHFLKDAALWSAGASLALPAWGTEPQNCSGPKPPPNPVKWTPDNNPILPRLAASTLAAGDVTKLRNAYKALRALTVNDPTDPRGWRQQGDKHCWNCGGGLDNQAGEEIHGSWLFFPWHRAYLYFHERILGNLINDKSLRLAYWDWDNAAHRSVPAAWLTPNNATNPLFDANRSAVAGNQIPNSGPNNLVGPTIMNPIMASSNFTKFGGSANTAGALENGPHGGVHIWTGDTTQQGSAADMGLLDTAAQDPIFFAHHSNIDRLWNVWLASAASHKNPTQASWLTHRFTFWDENKRWVFITIADVLNMSANLRYTYGTPAPHFTGGLPAPKQILLPFDPNKGVTLPDDARRRVSLAPAEGKPKLTVLRVENIQLPAEAKGIYRIVANRTGAVHAEIAGTPNDLGYIAIVPKSSKAAGHMHGTLSVDLDVTGNIAQLAQNNGTLQLSYVPVAGTTKSTQLKHGNVYLVEQ